MSQKRKSKEEIVAEYLTGNYTYRELSLIHLSASVRADS